MIYWFKGKRKAGVPPDRKKHRNKNSSGIGKKVLSMSLVLFMAFSILPTAVPKVSAASAVDWNMSSGTLNASDGTYRITGGSISGNNTTNITVPANANVRLNFVGNTTIDKRSATGANAKPAIDIGAGAKVIIQIEQGVTVTLYGSHGTKGASGLYGTTLDAYSGEGGYAGISVPAGAALVVAGQGSLLSYGGNAGDGGDNDTSGTGQAASSPNILRGYNGGWGSGEGGGGAGAGIGGNGADGGLPPNGNYFGYDGEDAPAVGKIYILNPNVTAKGGYGGDGGDVTGVKTTAGT